MYVRTPFSGTRLLNTRPVAHLGRRKYGRKDMRVGSESVVRYELHEPGTPPVL